MQKDFLERTSQKVVNFVMKTTPMKDSLLPDELENLIGKDLTARGDRVQSARLRPKSSQRSGFNRSADVIKDLR